MHAAFLARRFLAFTAALLLAMPLLATPLPAGAQPRSTVTVLAGPDSRAGDINASGQVVGDNGGNAWLHDGAAYIDLGSGAAYGINDSGQIVGSGRYHGQAAAFRLDPVFTARAVNPTDIVSDPIEAASVPEPATALLFLFAVFFLWLRKTQPH